MATATNFFAIEGGSRQLRSALLSALEARLKAAGHDVVVVRFDRHRNPDNHFVNSYLDGLYGNPNQIGLYASALLRATDHYHHAEAINDALLQGKIVLISEYTFDNLAFIGSRLSTPAKRQEFYSWLHSLEHLALNLPEPSKTLLLEPSTDSVRGKTLRQTFSELAGLFPDSLQVIPAIGEQPTSNQATADAAWKVLSADLTKVDATDLPATPVSEVIQRKQQQLNTEAPAGSRLEFSNNDLAVYVFKQPMLATTIDATANLQRGLAVRESNDQSKAEGESAFALHAVVEDASLLLALQLATQKEATVLQPKVDLLAADKKDARGNYKYVTPRTLNAEAAKLYEQTLDKVFDLHAKLVEDLSAYLERTSKASPAEAQKRARRALQVTLPLATKTALGIFAPADDFHQLIIELQSSAEEEALRVGTSLWQEIRKVTPEAVTNFAQASKTADVVELQQQTAKAIKMIAERDLHTKYSADREPVTLISASPRSELDLLPKMLFRHADASQREIEAALDSWSYAKKEAAFTAYLPSTGDALGTAQYTWELISDSTTLGELAASGAGSIERQAASPRYGYDTPSLVEEAELTDDFLTCFDLSLELHSKLQAAGYELEAQYACLQGHKLRWQWSLTAAQVTDIFSQKKLHTRSKFLLQTMHEALSEHHPLIAESVSTGSKNTKSV